MTFAADVEVWTPMAVIGSPQWAVYEPTAGEAPTRFCGVDPLSQHHCPSGCESWNIPIVTAQHINSAHERIGTLHASAYALGSVGRQIQTVMKLDSSYSEEQAWYAAEQMSPSPRTACCMCIRRMSFSNCT